MHPCICEHTYIYTAMKRKLNTWIRLNIYSKKCSIQLIFFPEYFVIFSQKFYIFLHIGKFCKLGHPSPPSDLFFYHLAPHNQPLFLLSLALSGISYSSTDLIICHFCSPDTWFPSRSSELYCSFFLISNLPNLCVCMCPLLECILYHLQLYPHRPANASCYAFCKHS